ncbi:MAG: sulfite exporter TauE/SafE family protein [Sphingomonadaceae bacterium]
MALSPDNLLLILGAFVAAVVSASAGFGGALLLLPLLVRSVGPEAAVPLLTVAQLAGNGTRVAAGWREIDWRPAGLFLLGALPAAVAGAHLFLDLPPGLLTRLAGLAILLFVALGWAGWRPPAGIGWLPATGAMTGFVSGVVGSAGPLGAAAFLALGLPPATYVATEAVTALAMHGAKLMVWGGAAALPAGFWPLAALLAAAMVAGTLVARRLVARIPARLFRRLVGALLLLVGGQMLIAG